MTTPKGERYAIGEGFHGDGVNAAHVNTMLGAKTGPVGGAWATALATPRAGHAAFVVVAAPNVPVKPMTLFVNKATIEGENERHGRLTWGAARVFDLPAGTLAAGAAADLTLFDPAAAWTVDRDRFLSKSRNSPFHGWEVRGRVRHTIVGGRVVHEA